MAKIFCIVFCFIGVHIVYGQKQLTISPGFGVNAPFGRVLTKSDNENFSIISNKYALFSVKVNYLHRKQSYFIGMENTSIGIGFSRGDANRRINLIQFGYWSGAILRFPVGVERSLGIIHFNKSNPKAIKANLHIVGGVAMNHIYLGMIDPPLKIPVGREKLQAEALRKNFITPFLGVKFRIILVERNICDVDIIYNKGFNTVFETSYDYQLNSTQYYVKGGSRGSGLSVVLSYPFKLWKEK